ncbi:hypothetical protein F4677DRAFT_442520 [Hypoxylon crocopeplum]|nr:hypothetical protein F4677DRAFT_442520 [Hypoxylon crocopeplum]
MVRIKERYLLVKILYPDELGNRQDLPDVVVINQPTTDQLNPATLLRGIRAEVASLFGDYGSGAIEGGSLGGNLNFHSENLTSGISLSLGGSHFHDLRPG